MSDLISIGGARLRAFGLKPLRISRHSEARFPGSPTFYDMDYQETGQGERVSHIEAETMPHVFGGLDALAILEALHLSRRAVLLLRMSGNFLAVNQGLVVVRSLDVDEEGLHPADGVGRKVAVQAELLHVASLARPFGSAA